MKVPRLPSQVRKVFEALRIHDLMVAVLRGRTVKRSMRFAAREVMAAPPEPVAYRLRGSGLAVVVAHRTPDVLGLDQMFIQRACTPPDIILDRLRRCDPLRVLDVGANIGLFGLQTLEWFPHAQITAFEPDQRNADLHRKTIQLNQLDRSWKLVEAAATVREGTAQFSSGNFALSRLETNEQGDGTESVATIDLFSYMADVDLVKLDIEGGEWEILADERFADSASMALSLEYHPHLCPSDGPRRTARAALEAVGYEVVDVPIQAADGHGSLWAWR